MMTKDEARQVIRLAHAPHASAGQLSTYTSAAKTLAEPPSIAQAIRDAAINWPQYLGGVECSIMAAFAYEGERDDCIFGLHMAGIAWAEEETIQSRTYMLLVAEALE